MLFRSGVGTTIVFNVGRQDAKHFAQDFLKPVRPDDIRALKRREALVRIGSDMAKVRTLDRPSVPELHFRDEIIEQSHQKYYRPVTKVQELVRHRHRGSTETFSPLVPDEHTSPGKSPPVRLYDEL